MIFIPHNKPKKRRPPPEGQFTGWILPTNATAIRGTLWPGDGDIAEDDVGLKVEAGANVAPRQPSSTANPTPHTHTHLPAAATEPEPQSRQRASARSPPKAHQIRPPVESSQSILCIAIMHSCDQSHVTLGTLYSPQLPSVSTRPLNPGRQHQRCVQEQHIERESLAGVLPFLRRSMLGSPEQPCVCVVDLCRLSVPTLR